MEKKNIRMYFYAFILAVTVILNLSQQASARPNMDEMANMAEALRYLEKLDKYYSQMARPRFGRSISDTRPGKRDPFIPIDLN
ncbi:neuropeptide F-like [Panonychus citri]|uniref:neuropeptide F-like n=1 Tax=Panonychus citri TaxID=50023 RepID=UPI002307684E|nr:neuropeptide F-like [Panonychus citri]XP_053206549.1 neuropeptide F-like [Panonychus citri]XP_053206550.1 neuropeptide F-like [Panonychus citri]